MNETPRDPEHTIVPSTSDDKRPIGEGAKTAKCGSTEQGEPRTDADQALENLKEMLDSGEENPG